MHWFHLIFSALRFFNINIKLQSSDYQNYKTESRLLEVKQRDHTPLPTLDDHQVNVPVDYDPTSSEIQIY